MSEVKSEYQVEMEQIQKEYAGSCTQAGDLQYKIADMQDALAQLNMKIRNLNIDYRKAQEKQEKLAKEKQTESKPVEAEVVQ